MPKARQTCTRCSMRRQKCDKKEPCGRCAQAGEGNSCSRTWIGGYDARIHRTYPKGGALGPQVFPQAIEAIRAASPNNRNVCFDDDVEQQQNHVRFRERDIGCLAESLPTADHILNMVSYHQDYLQWIHGCIHGPTFREEVVRALQRGNGRMPLHELDLRWCALLFAVLTVSLTCAPAPERVKWKYDRRQKAVLTEKWHEAAIECLVLGGFNSNLHPRSVQTIQTLALSSHILGSSRRQFIMSGTALRIAQGLGLHRLPYERDEVLGQVSRDIQLSRETGRRIWWNLVSYDWLSISAFEMYSINPRQFTTHRPRSYSLKSGARGVEYTADAEADYCNHMLDLATVLLESHTSTSACIDASLSYEQVLKYDARLRELGRRGFETSETSSPWLPLGQELTRSAIGHKIIILHRIFLVRSFRDPTFSYTRWASMEGSKIIVKECSEAFARPERPTIYFEQAWLISAGITFCLDIMHRGKEEAEYQEHVRLVEQAIRCLAQCEDSVLASRGYRLLSTMLEERLNDTRVDDPGLLSTQQDHAPGVLAGFDCMLMSDASGREASGCSAWLDACVPLNIGNLEHRSVEQLPTPETDGPLLFDGVLPQHDQQKIVHPGAVTTSEYFRPMPAAYNVTPATLDELLADFSWTNMLSEFLPDSGGAASFGGTCTRQVPMYQ